MSKAGMTPPPKGVQLLKYVKNDAVHNFLKKHRTLFKESEDAEASEGGVEHGEKKPAKQRVIDEEDTPQLIRLLLHAYRRIRHNVEDHVDPNVKDDGVSSNKVAMASLCQQLQRCSGTATTPSTLKCSSKVATSRRWKVSKVIRTIDGKDALSGQNLAIFVIFTLINLSVILKQGDGYNKNHHIKVLKALESFTTSKDFLPPPKFHSSWIVRRHPAPSAEAY
ncbi:hypothetical protein Tco_0718206 [Tanacetum coccineum]